MSFSKEAIENNYFSDDELEKIYQENIKKLKDFDYTSLGIQLSEDNINIDYLLGKFRVYKIIGFNIGKYSNFNGYQSKLVCGCPDFSESYDSYFIYIIYVDIFGNCYGQIQPERINKTVYDHTNYSNNSREKINWGEQLFYKPFLYNIGESVKKTTLKLIMESIDENQLLQYSCGDCSQQLFKYFSSERFKNTGFNNFINLEENFFKNIGEKCNEVNRLKTEYQSTLNYFKDLNIEKNKILKNDHGNDFFIEFNEFAQQIIVKKSINENLNLLDIIPFKIKKVLINGKIIDEKIGQTYLIIIEDCINLKKITNYVEELQEIYLKNCPNIKEIECHQKISLFIDDKQIEKFVKKDQIKENLLKDLLVELQELRKFREGVETHYPAMIELLRQRIEKLEKS